ncbi:MAG: S9 family peptidase [Candidatus Eisenbacteria bacterium]|nr:S9 family peptidase [Candidatus Eisenbacteria bacterium]
MSRFFRMALLAMIAFAVLAPAPAAHAADAPSIAQFLKIRTPGLPDLLPDGSLLQRDWPEGVFQLYRTTPKVAGANASYAPDQVTRTKLTNFPDGVAGFSLSPDGKRCLVMHARGGNENTQISLIDPMSNGIATLTPIVANPRVQASVNAWLRDGSGFYYSANDESPNDFYLYRWDFATAKATKVWSEAGQWEVNDVTADGKRLLIMQIVSASDTRIWEFDLASGAKREITIKPANGTAACGVVGYLPGEKSVMLSSDLIGGMQRLFAVDLKTLKRTEPLPALSKFELDGAEMNDVHDMLIVTTNEDGYAVPHFYSLPGYKPVAGPAMEKGVVNGSVFRGSTVVWSLSNARNAGQGYMTTFVKGGAPVTKQLTWTENNGVDLSRMRLPELVRYTAFDGKQIPAFLYVPEGFVKGKPIPFVVYYHGGPESQNRPGFSAALQYLVARGYGLILPNVRGSTGYGREFQMLDDYKKRWDSVRDGVDVAEWLVKEGYSTPGRIATYGGSYGGFMSVACIVEDQERVEAGKRKDRLFGACVDVVGIVNLQTFLEKTSGYRRKLREVEYGPLTDPDFLRTVSSIHKVDKMKVPFFIAHGFNDPRVPVEEAMQIAVALKDRKLSPRVFIAPDEGHGFQKLDNRIYFNERMVQFFDETIGAAGASGATP